MPRISARPDFLRRIIQVRRDTYGELGAEKLAELLGIPLKTWENFEAGIVIPDMLLLQFLSLTRTNPDWLLSGEGPPYVAESAASSGRDTKGGG